MQRAFAVAIGLFSGLAMFAIVWGLTASKPVAMVVAVVALIAVTITSTKGAFFRLDPNAVPFALKCIAAVVAILALVQVGRITVFMIDPTAERFSNLPFSQFEVHHSCLSSYYCALEAVDTQPDIYAETIYAHPSEPGTPRRPKMLGSFRIDQYEYPPPFLLVPRVLHAAAPEFLQHRALWFGLNLIVIAGAMLFATRSLGGPAATRAVLLIPLAFAAIPTLSMLQKGNVQGLVIAISVLSTLCFARGKNVLGGTLLAYAIASKLYPGLLVIYFLVKRQWSAVIWTAVMGAVLVAISLADVGLKPYIAFIDHLPKLLGGEAFGALRNPGPTAVNLSVPGIVLKLRLFDVPGMTFALSKVVGWVYTVIAVAFTVAIARRARTQQEQLLAVLAILILATLRSPFLPIAYGLFPALWVLTLAAAARQPTTRVLVATMLAFAAMFMFASPDMLTPKMLVLTTLLPQIALTAAPIYIWTQMRSSDRLPEGSRLQPAQT